MQKEDRLGIRIGVQTFMQSVFILLGMMIFAGFLTRLIQPGFYERSIENGAEVIIPNSFHYATSIQPYPIYRWFTAPFEIFLSKDAPVVIVIILFILFIGGSFAIFDATKVFERLVQRLAKRFEFAHTLFIAIISLFFMLLGALFGIFEEIIPLIPIVVLISKRMGWDELMGLGLSLLATGFGFSAAIFNPFTIGIAQQLAGLPLFSGVLYRLLIFVVIYLVLVLFLTHYAKRFDSIHTTNGEARAVEISPTNSRSDKALTLMGIEFSVLLLLMMIMPFIGLSNYSMPFIALGFVGISLSIGRTAGYRWKELAGFFKQGLMGIAPSGLLIMMAMSVKHIILSGHIMDSLLYMVSSQISNLSPAMAGLWMYLSVFILQFFIPSASAKAFLVIPILAPLGDLLSITRQNVVLAFNFGDGFSHLLYPTDPALLIALSLTSVKFSKWLRWTFLLQVVVFLLTVAFLIMAIWFGYGPR